MIGVRLVRAVVRLYPPEFRAAFGRDVVSTYLDACDRLGHTSTAAGASRVRLMLARAKLAVTSAASLLFALPAVYRDNRQRRPRDISPYDRRPNRMQNLWQDVRYAWRSLRKQPAFAVVAIATLALGIGANTAVFSVLSSVVLAPLPYADPGHLVRLYSAGLRTGNQRSTYLTTPDIVDVRDGAASFSSLGIMNAYRESGEDLLVSGVPQRVRVMPVNAEYFTTLGATPDVGRPFTRDEERPGISRVILSHALWTSIAAGRTNPLGASVELDGRQYEIIGVMRAGFRDPGGTNVAAWIPQNLLPDKSNQRGNYYLSAIARLAPGVSLAQARADVDRIMNRVRATLPASDSALANSMQLSPLLDDVVGDSRTPMYILMGAAALVLLIACINVASLFLARSVTLTHESAIRTALGAARSRLVAQRLTESLLIAGAGGLVGSVIAVSGVKVLLLVSPDSVARAETVGFNPVLLAFGLAATVLSAVLFGVAPALRASRVDPADALHDHSRGNTTGRRAGYARNVLVASQVALALMLLVGAGVLVRSFAALEHTDLGFDPGHIATFDINLPNARYGTPAQRVQAHHRLHEALAAIPGVTAVGATSWLPGNGPYHTWGYAFVGASGARQSAPVQVRVIDGDFFGAFRVKPSSGGVLMRAGFADTIRDAVVNQSLAHRAFGDAAAMGRTLYLNGDLMRVVGVVPNLAFDARGSVADQIYLSHDEYANNRSWTLTYVVRTTAEASSVVPAARAAIASVDPQLVLYEPTTMVDVLGRHRAPQEFTLLLMGIFGAVALTLAAVGVYGVLSYAVTQRTHEIGVRIALGAPVASVRAIVARQAALVAGVGMVVGLAGAFVLSGLMRSLVFGVNVRDPLVFCVVTATLAAVIALAGYMPARRATRIEPLEALRGE